MAENLESSSFFGSKNHDRVYKATDWADYFFPLFISGVFNGHLQVVENEGMSIKINPGYAWIDGYKYRLKDEMALDLEMASGNKNRTDSIVIRLDLTNKWIRAFRKTGDYYAGKATPPAPEISATIHELVIAHISVKAGTTKITQDMIEDTRMDKTICGWVCGAVEQIDFTQITMQFEAFFANYREEILNVFNTFLGNAENYDAEFLAWIEEKKEEITTWKSSEEAETDAWQEEKSEEFTEWATDIVNRMESWMLSKTENWQNEIMVWFNNLREHITENAEVHLQEQIGNLDQLETKEKDNLVNAINSMCLSYDETMEMLRGVKTVTVKLSTNDGVSVVGQTVTMHNVAAGEEEIKEYTEGGISFEVIGDTEYRLSFSDMEFHVTPEPIMIFAMEDKELDVQYELNPLKDLPWSKIIEIAENGEASKYFKIHDQKEIVTGTNTKIIVEIIGFDHDTIAGDEERKAGITFGTTHCVSLNHMEINTNGIGWRTSYMRSTILANIFDTFPEELKNGIKEVIKKTLKNDNLETTEENLWLFSGKEIGLNTNGTDYRFEGEKYPAFTDDNAREKPYGIRNPYWLRSSYWYDSIIYYQVVDERGGDADGEWVDGRIARIYGTVIGFCV